MFSQEKLQSFMAVASQAVTAQVVPSIFSASQIAEMNLPHHHYFDHYNCGFMGGGDGDGKFHSTTPQLAIYDPRISADQIAQAAKKVTFDFDGEHYDFQVRIYQSCSTLDIQEWQQGMSNEYECREAIENLEPGLKSKFRLVSGKNCSINHGSSHEAQFTVLLFNKSSQKRQDNIRAYVEAELKTMIPTRPVSVDIGGMPVPLKLD